MISMKGRTPLGKFITKLRVDNGQSVRAMGEVIGCSGAYVSDVETGKKQLTMRIAKAIIEKYNLQGDKLNEFKKLYLNSIWKKMLLKYAELRSENK